MLRVSLPTMIELTLNTRCDRDSIRADPAQIQEVIMNLCTNAKDARPAGGLLQISFKERQLTELPDLGMKPGRYVVLKVRDTGQGINEIVKRRIFEPFFSTKEPGKGMGMGLAIVDGIVRGLNGAVDVTAAALSRLRVNSFCGRRKEPSSNSQKDFAESWLYRDRPHKQR